VRTRKLFVSHATITPPADFNFWHTVYSHGWCSLPPFSCSPEKRELYCTFRLSNGDPVRCELGTDNSRIHCTFIATNRLTSKQRVEAVSLVKACLRCEEDVSPFHREAQRYPHYRWIAKERSGRLLRAPTMFEDVVKMICTTNCTWALTTLMVTNLVNALGVKLDGYSPAFPTPGAIAGSTERFLRKEIKAGYRAPFLLELAGRTASGECNPEEWRTSTRATEDLFEEMRGVKGVGPYAAGNLLRLVGRYDYLGLDSWVRARYAALHRKGRPASDRGIERQYAQYGTWRGLFFWLEMTRHWHEDKFES
jgi:3-methyladenine DNA glycosylase/8-oxoguanine DNA glycosylase